MSRRAQAKLTEAKTANKVVFAYNPEKITIRHTQKLSGFQNAKNYDSYLESQGIPTISMDGLTIYGTNTKTACDQLLEWSRPVSEETASRCRTPNNSKPRLLEFSWGEPKTGMSFQAHLETVTVVYTRFSPVTAQPLRATVALSFRKVEPPAPKQNPTSGGPPGRRVHALDSSESLAGVTMAAYGRPDAWRDVARANRIADPLRVRPGTEIFLPDFDELTDHGSRS